MPMHARDHGAIRAFAQDGELTLARTLHCSRAALLLGKVTLMKKLAIASCVGFMMMGALQAQEFSRFAFNIGAGFTQAVGDTGTRLDMGWNGRLGAGVNFNPYVGLMVNGAYDSMGINSSTLTNIGVPGGRMSVMSFTLDPIVHLNPKGHVDIYVT